MTRKQVNQLPIVCNLFCVYVPIYISFPDKYLNLALPEKRARYKCGKKYVVIEDVKSWASFYNDNKDKLKEKCNYFTTAYYLMMFFLFNIKLNKNNFRYHFEFALWYYLFA